MEIQQGFNRIGIAVAATFLALSAICVIIAGMKYLEYRKEIATEYQKVFGTSPQEQNNALLLLNGPEETMKSWNTLKKLRYRSVEQYLELAAMCVCAASISFIFWFLVGRAYVAVLWRYRQRKASDRLT